MIQHANKKGADLIYSVVEAARHNAVKKGLAEERLFVKECIIGKKLGQKKLDIKARGKMGIMYAPISSIRVVLEEKSPADFYKMMLKGECPPCMAFVFRKMLYQSDADFEQVKELSFLTTSQGRYYRKTQFNRLIQLI